MKIGLLIQGKIGQRKPKRRFISRYQAGYLVNPATNLKLFGSYIYRGFDPTTNTAITFNQSTNWFTLGLRVMF
jgi:hypothetical protein